MKSPQFTTEENYAISYTRSRESSTANYYLVGYALSTSLIFGYGAYHSYIPVMVIAFSVFVSFRLYEEYHGLRWHSVWRSILDKYDAALAKRSDQSEGEQ